MDARFRGLARRTQAPRVEQTKERTRDGRPTCFTCGRTGHLQTSCPERRNPGYRSQMPPQQRTERPNYSENSGYNQSHDNYRSFAQQSRRDQRLAVLDENWYDDEFVAQFRHTPSKQGYSGPDLRHQHASSEQEHVEILSNGTVVFSKRRPENAMNLHQDFMPQQSPSSRNYAAVSSQSFSAQFEVKQPPLPGIFCFNSGSANSQATPGTILGDQPLANVNVNSLLFLYPHP